jgi:hypothetical protein
MKTTFCALSASLYTSALKLSVQNSSTTEQSDILSSVNETEHFINTGFGWTCKRCLAETNARADASDADARLPRFFNEGEAEERDPTLSAPALARWRDDSHNSLVCPRCGSEEKINS